MALVAVELETLVSEPDALTTRPPPQKTCRQKTFSTIVFNVTAEEYDAFLMQFRCNFF